MKAMIMKLLRLILTVLPDSYHPDDESWSWAWDELSYEAQEEVKRLRSEIVKFLETEDNEREDP